MTRRNIVSVTALLTALLLCLALVLPAMAENSAPVAENFEFETYRGVSFGGELSAIDPDGDVLRYEITTEPVKGELSLGDDGSFVYTPFDGKRGRDYFGYKAVDEKGNVSQEATVIIKLLKNAPVSYADMEGEGSYYAAVRLAESGAFIGKQLGGEYFFEPADTVTRGEFLSMCLNVTDADILSGVVSTGFFDDEGIPAWEKGYVSTAVKNGIVYGRVSDEGAVFDANKPVSRAEAASMLNRTLRLSDVSYTEDSAVPSWAAQSVYNLAACDVMSAEDAMDAPLSRAEAADMLLGAMNIVEARGE